MKNDISQPDFCQILPDFPEKPDSGSEKPDIRSRNLFVLKKYFGQGDYYMKISPKSVK